MVDFLDRDEVKLWLDAIEPAQRRREVAVALAARAALRVTPLLGRELTVGGPSRGNLLSALVLPSLRAAALRWVAAKYPTHGNELRAAGRAAVADIAPDTAPSAAANASFAASFAADAAAAAHAAASETDGDAALAADFAVAAADAVDADAAAAAAAAAFASDAALVDSGRSGAELAGLPLWPNGAPEWASEAWRTLKSALLAADQGWEVWTAWYEARLAGDAARPPNEALEVARATIPDEIWKQGPAAVNAEIKRLIELHETNSGTTKETPQPIPVVVSFTMPLEIGAAVTASAESLAPGNSLPPIPAPKPAAIESIPEQERTGTCFGVDAQGRIDVVRIPPATDELQRLHYDEVRQKALALVALGQMLGDVALPAKRILEALPERMEDASVDKLWSRANTLRRRHDAHVRAIENDLGPDPARLHPLVAANLGDFVDSFNVYVLGDPRALELDSARLGPQDREAVRKVVALAAPIARAAEEPLSPATPAAQEALAEQVDAAIDAPDDINGDQAADLARKTTGNFVSELLRRAYAPIAKFGAVVKTEAMFAQKEFRSGLYRAPGTAAFAGLSVAAYAYWPEISAFVVRNADALKAFVTEAFHNPKLVEIIDWIVHAAGQF
jgi:hypothetical protein